MGEVPHAFSGIRAVVFDLDDTLINWREAEQGAIADIARLHLASYGEERVRQDYQDVMHENFVSFRATGRWWTISDRLDLLRRRLDAPVATEALVADFRVHVHRRLQLFPGALEAVAACRDRGRGVAMLTNGPANVQRPKVELLGLAAHFDYVGITGEFGHWKPSAEAFHHVLGKLGCPPAEAAMVGDSLDFDIRPAKRLGMRTVWVAPDGSADPDADLVVPGPAQLVPHLAVPAS
jgi:putative hydrolase of the HAD superfamily